MVVVVTKNMVESRWWWICAVLGVGGWALTFLVPSSRDAPQRAA